MEKPTITGWGVPFIDLKWLRNWYPSPVEMWGCHNYWTNARPQNGRATQRILQVSQQKPSLHPVQSRILETHDSDARYSNAEYEINHCHVQVAQCLGRCYACRAAMPSPTEAPPDGNLREVWVPGVQQGSEWAMDLSWELPAVLVLNPVLFTSQNWSLLRRSAQQFQMTQ